MGRYVIKKRNKKHLRQRKEEIVKAWMHFNASNGGFKRTGFASTPEAEYLSQKYSLPIESLEDIGYKGCLEIHTRDSHRVNKSNLRGRRNGGKR